MRSMEYLTAGQLILYEMKTPCNRFWLWGVLAHDSASIYNRKELLQMFLFTKLQDAVGPGGGQMPAVSLRSPVAIVKPSYRSD